MRKEQTSVFDEIIEELAQITTSRETEEEFLHIQQLETRIIRAYNNGYFNHREYKTAANLADIIKGNMRLVLRKGA